MKYERPIIEEIRILDTHVFLEGSTSQGQEDDPWWDEDYSIGPLNQLSEVWNDSGFNGEPTYSDSE